jgi:hypothetical protein
MLVTKTSQLAKTESTLDLDITQDQLNRVNLRYTTGELIQNIVPNLSVEEREFLISGITPTEWNQLFNTIEN